MKILINLPETYYIGCKNKMVLDTTVEHLVDAIAEGIVLPDNITIGVNIIKCQNCKYWTSTD